jgi:hypothetical protein
MRIVHPMRIALIHAYHAYSARIVRIVRIVNLMRIVRIVRIEGPMMLNWVGEGSAKPSPVNR